MPIESPPRPSERTGADPLKDWLHEHAKWWNRVCLLLIMVSSVVIVWSLPVRQFAGWLHDWFQSAGPGGAAIFVGVFTALSLTCLPTWFMPFISGAAFGPVWGTLIASGACVFAAMICFAIARGIGRTGLREYLERSPRMRALEHTVRQGSWKIVAAIRVSHFMPFGMQNYAFGLTGIGFWTFTIATGVVTLPGITLQVYLGYLGFTSVEAWRDASSADWAGWGLRITGLIAIAIAVGYIGYLGRSVYRKAVKEQLERELEEERHSPELRGRWPRLPLVLGGLALFSMAAAAGAFLERDALRAYSEGAALSQPKALTQRHSAAQPRPIDRQKD
ncbi:MAG: VTT domain-containing protein [Planctomycetaceae bacterium]